MVKESKAKRFITYIRENSKNFIKKYLVKALILVSVIITFLVFFNSSFFNIQGITIEPFSGEKINYADQVQILEEIKYIEGQNYFKINEKEIKDRIKSKFYIVENVVVEKNLPNTITVKLQERKPFITININESSCAVLDKSSFVFDIATTTENCTATSGNYMTYYVNLVNNTNIYTVNSISNEYLTNSLNKIINEIEKNNFKINVLTVHEDYLEVLLTNKSILIFTLGDDLDIEIIRLNIIIKELNKDYREFKSLDLRYERPIVKF